MVNKRFGVWVRSLLLPLIINYLRYRRNRIQNIEELVDLAYNCCKGLPFSHRLNATFGIVPIQIRDEITELLRIVSKLRPRTLLEIGTAHGGTLFLFASVSHSEATIISVDLPASLGGYPDWRSSLYKSFAREKQKIFLIRGDSHDFKTLRKVREVLAGRKLDFLFIDGDHSYEGVKRDFEMYSPLVREGGIIAFHDIVPGSYYPWVKNEVHIFWNEIKKNYKYKEIIKYRSQKGFGIGVLYV